jgi:hypothetical protein
LWLKKCLTTRRSDKSLVIIFEKDMIKDVILCDNKKGDGQTTSMSRKLPVGIQAFESLRKGQYVYVGKTEYI